MTPVWKTSCLDWEDRILTGRSIIPPPIFPEEAERALRLPAPGAALLPGLAVGDTRAVDEKLNDAMLASGLSHLTAVSGSNFVAGRSGSAS